MVRLSILGVVLVLLLSSVGGVVSGATGATGPAVVDTADRGQVTGTAANRTADSQFDFALVNTTNCGIACREVTVSATNVGNDTVSNVTASTRLVTGERVLWEGSETVERLGPGESATATKQVQIGFFDAIAVRQNGGWVTANTTVTWDGGRETFVERRKVT